jgi:hypothetical protein
MLGRLQTRKPTYAWTTPNDHILIDRRRHSSALDVQSFRTADCTTDHYLLVAKIRGRLVVNKQESQKIHMERFNLKKLNDVEGIEKYRVEVSNRIAALEDMDAEVEINTVRETIRESIKISAKESLGYYKLKKNKPWFNKERSKLLDQWKQAKLQWLQDPSEINGDSLNNARCEASRHFKNKKMEYLKDKINELAMNGKNKNISGMYNGMNE